MKEGFMLDYTYGGQAPTSWVEGAPVDSFWVGTNVRGKERWRLEGYRCADCGYVKTYARQHL